MLVQKNKKETITEKAHIDLYYNGIFIGYIIKNESTLAVNGENWNFCSKNYNIPNCFDKTKTLLIDKLKKICIENKL